MHLKKEHLFKKGRIPWNKGRKGTFQHSDEAKRKISESHKGKCFSNEHKQKISEVMKGNKRFLGKYHTDETKKKMSEVHKGKHWSNEVKKKISASHKGQHHSDETKKKISNANRGEKNSNWHGGLSFLPYSPLFNNILKRTIKQRDRNKCQNPKCRGESSHLVPHHIDYDKKNCCPINLITLCNICNSKANFHRGEWKPLYQKIVQKRTTKYFMRMSA